ncbi:MAG TPA: hypothetical protein VIG28_08365 [Leifsonia sp.]|jgi:hypothetical protein
MTVYLPDPIVPEPMGMRPTRAIPASYADRVDAFERIRDAAARTLPQLPR